MLAKANINVSFMTVNRLGKGKDAIMAIGLDEKPDQVTTCLRLCSPLLSWCCTRSLSECHLTIASVIAMFLPFNHLHLFA